MKIRMNSASGSPIAEAFGVNTDGAAGAPGPAGSLVVVAAARAVADLAPNSRRVTASAAQANGAAPGAPPPPDTSQSRRVSPSPDTDPWAAGVAVITGAAARTATGGMTIEPTPPRRDPDAGKRLSDNGVATTTGAETSGPSGTPVGTAISPLSAAADATSGAAAGTGAAAGPGPAGLSSTASRLWRGEESRPAVSVAACPTPSARSPTPPSPTPRSPTPRRWRVCSTGAGSTDDGEAPPLGESPARERPAAREAPEESSEDRADPEPADPDDPVSAESEPVAPADPAVSANATGIDTTAEPIPKATANAPTRPTQDA
jgi:hypothetical protein